MKIYVASSWRNNIQPDVVEALRKAGHEVYDFKNPPGRTGFSWAQISTGWMHWTAAEFIEALKHPISEAGYKSDFDAMDEADLCVLVLPSGRSAHTEAGWFAGSGKLVCVLTGDMQEPELMYKIFNCIATSIQGVVDYVNETQAGLNNDGVAYNTFK